MVMPTVAGKGVVPDDHPLSAGAVMARGHAKKFMAGADVVLAVGTELSETDFWEERIPFTGKLDPHRYRSRQAGRTVVAAI